MQVPIKQMLIAAGILGIFAIIGTSLVAFTQQHTKALIAANQRQVLLNKLEQLIPADQVDNDMVLDAIQVHYKLMLGNDQTTVYRARMKGKPVAVVLTSTAPDGYSGDINLLVAVRTDGSLAGVRLD